MYELKTTFEHYFPENFQGGECAAFAEGLIAIGLVGDTNETKLQAVTQRGILVKDLKQFIVGDCVVLKLGQAGHVAVVNSIVGDKLTLTESNWHLDKLVHHTRQISITEPDIVGVLRGILKVNVLNPVKTFKIKLVQNQKWPSIQQKIDECSQRLRVSSQNRLDFEVSISQTIFDVSKIPFIQEINSKIIDPNWYKENITPFGKGFDFIYFSFQDPSPFFLGSLGYTNDQSINPIECSGVVTSENEQVGSTTLPDINVFIETFLHEIFGHGLRLFTNQNDRRPDNTFLVHDYLNQTKFDLTGLLNLVDYSKLNPIGNNVKLTTSEDGKTFYIEGDKGKVGIADPASLELIQSITSEQSVTTDPNVLEVQTLSQGFVLNKK